MACLGIALEMVIIVVAVDSRREYEDIGTGAAAILEHYQASTRRPLCSAPAGSRLMLRGKTFEVSFRKIYVVLVSIASRMQRML